MRFILVSLLIIPLYIAIPAIILYFVIKTAIKNAIRELKRENIL